MYVPFYYVLHFYSPPGGYCMEIIILILIIAIIAIQIYTKVNDKTKLTKTLEDISFMINNPEATIKEKIMYSLNFKYKNQILLNVCIFLKPI